MMYKKDNGEPVFHVHKCAERNKGKEMSIEELQKFAVEILMKEYAEAGVIVNKHDKANANEADFQILYSGKKPGFIGDFVKRPINVLVVYQEEPDKDISGIDTSWMVEEYHHTGAIPRITFATAWCESEKSKNGKPAISGGSFCFKYYSVSLVPGQENKKLDKKLTAIELAVKYAYAWIQHDASIIEPYLDKDFHYSSNWVFDEMPSRYEYIHYFAGKLASLVRDNIQYKFGIAKNRQSGEVAVILLDCDFDTLRITTQDGRITSACMSEYDSKFQLIDPKDELYQVHGDHIDTLMPVGEFFENHIGEIMEKSVLWRKNKTEVTTEERYNCKADVHSLMYGDGDFSMLATIVHFPYSNNNCFLSTYPIAKGKPLEVKIDKVIEWDNQIEATILCSIGEFDFAFFAVDYYANRTKYEVGKTVYVDIAAIGMNIKESQRGFSFEGQQAIDWLSKIGRKPDYDENGNVMPIHFCMEQLVSFFNLNSKCPDEAEFHSPVGPIESTSFMNIDFFKTEIMVCRRDTEEGHLEVSVPLYFRKDFLPEVKEGDPICGWIWVTGNITGQHDKIEYSRDDISIADICLRFDEYMRDFDFEEFDNLMPILSELPQIKLRQGYEFDAFRCGDKYGWILQPYVCKENPSCKWEPQIEENTGKVLTPYEDHLRIHNTHSWAEGMMVPSAIDYFEVPFTEIAIIQAWLLYNMSDYMPRGWHSNYDAKQYIFDPYVTEILFPDKMGRNDSLSAALIKSRMPVKNEFMKLDMESLLPSVTIENNQATIKYVYWNDWSGLVQETVIVTPNGSSVRFQKGEKTVLLRYECDITF